MISTIQSHHEEDTDFEVSKTPESSTTSNTHDSLPTIRRPKTRYQALMERRAAESHKAKNEDNSDISVEKIQDEDSSEKNAKSMETSQKSEDESSKNSEISDSNRRMQTRLQRQIERDDNEM